MTTKAARLAATVNDLRYVTQQLLVISDEFVKLLGDDPEFAAALPEPTILHQPESAPVVEVMPVTLVEVRAVLAELSRDGHTDQVRELLVKHGAPKLSEIDPANYAALLADAELIGKATNG